MNPFVTSTDGSISPQCRGHRMQPKTSINVMTNIARHRTASHATSNVNR